LGHGPWSHSLEAFAIRSNVEFVHEDMSVQLLRLIVTKYQLPISAVVVDAACAFIQGLEYPTFPRWLSHIIANKETDVDLDKFDYLARDVNRTLATVGTEYMRLISNSRIVAGELAYKMAEALTIDCLFHHRADMLVRVYTHRFVAAVEMMVIDALIAAQNSQDSKVHVAESLSNPEDFVLLDDRLSLQLERGDGGLEAQQIMQRISERKSYSCIGEVRMPFQGDSSLSQMSLEQIEETIAQCAEGDIKAEELRVVRSFHRYGLNKSDHPLKSIPFWRHGCDSVCHLRDDEVPCIAPVHFRETAFKIFLTDPEKVKAGQKAFELWRQKWCGQK
jgi:HD superfamily phosphohydrolase